MGGSSGLGESGGSWVGGQRDAGGIRLKLTITPGVITVDPAAKQDCSDSAAGCPAVYRTDPGAHAQVLLVRTRLAQGPRTETAALRELGQERRFERYHLVLNRARWSGLRGARILLGVLILLVPPTWALVISVDETLERRRGERIAAKGMFSDAVRSRRSKVVICLGRQPRKPR